jgi:Zn ribbon nucleic-acid-binding protein
MVLEYITTRDLENKSGQIKGKLRIMKMKESSKATVDFICPECSKSEKVEKEWKEPFVEGSGANQKFNLNCNECGYSQKIMKLKKKEKKKK